MRNRGYGAQRNARRGASVALVAVALLTGACRSDGGIGRRDAEHGWEWTAGVIAERHARDVARTAENLDGIAAWLEREVTDPLAGCRRTLALYLEGDSQW